jgi:hypothetical protein
MTETAEQKATASTGVSDSMALLAAQIARAVFKTGDEAPRFGGETRRIQFVGSQQGREFVMGGLCEDALVRVIANALAANKI